MKIFIVIELLLLPVLFSPKQIMKKLLVLLVFEDILASIGFDSNVIFFFSMYFWNWLIFHSNFLTSLTF